MGNPVVSGGDEEMRAACGRRLCPRPAHAPSAVAVPVSSSWCAAQAPAGPGRGIRTRCDRGRGRGAEAIRARTCQGHYDPEKEERAAATEEEKARK
ncbi:unnamed protein product [Miscanthus lutarioriparius]|uniref:Uncharacterized protein n=1 Tax=Miscanthus lutarioriparius TaxID=422564 RepID=A0A811MV03_9POAL|nr:unnamed protein product [Miscanthus lutarioriparius]